MVWAIREDGPYCVSLATTVEIDGVSVRAADNQLNQNAHLVLAHFLFYRETVYCDVVSGTRKSVDPAQNDFKAWTMVTVVSDDCPL